MKTNHLFTFHLNAKPFSKAATVFTPLVLAATSMQASTDYGPAIWRPACHYSTGGAGKKFVVIHDMEGYYLSVVNWFQQCSAPASIHYYVNGKTDYSGDAAPGEVSQGVREAYYAWHVRCWNSHCLGTEHEGFAANPAWYTDAMYNASGALQSHMCNKFGIAKDRNHVVAHGQESFPGWPSYASSHFGVDPYCNSHTDPGPHWNWSKFMALVISGGQSPPRRPSGLRAVARNTHEIRLTWDDNSNNEDGFHVDRWSGVYGDPWVTGANLPRNSKAYTAGQGGGLQPGTKYYFRVSAYNEAGETFSGMASATTKDTIPNGPTSLTATAANNSQINLTWSGSGIPNEDGFKIKRSLDQTNWVLAGTAAINATTFNDTGLSGNVKYYYKVFSFNTAGWSVASNIASDTTAPQSPNNLTAVTGADYSIVELSWNDRANAEVGFKIERATASAGPYTQIATNAASVTTYTDTGRLQNTAYYYRVRSYNANGNSSFSSVASLTTPNAPPVLSAIGEKVVASGGLLTFSVNATDPNGSITSTNWRTFEGFSYSLPNGDVMFNRPSHSGFTSGFLETTTNYSLVVSSQPSGNGSASTLKAHWQFKTGTTNPWVRYNTQNTPKKPNSTIKLDQSLQFKVYSTRAIKIGLGIRESGTTADVGDDGGTTGPTEWVGVTNIVNGNPIPNKYVPADTWTTVKFNIPFEPQTNDFNVSGGNGLVAESGKGVLSHLIIHGAGGSGVYGIYFDDFTTIDENNLTYTLDAGAPSGASIHRKTGAFKWTPSAGQVGTYNITVRVTDKQGATDFETIPVTVTGAGNAAPVLATIGNKTVNENTALSFTATATDANGGQTKTFSLDAGNPSGSSINSASGAFAWTPTEAQGPGSYPITVRVTDNGSPASNDFETITVTVRELNTAPALASISDQTINEGSTLNITASAADTDLPANTLTYSLEPGAPAGMTINSSSGAISWTSSDSDGGDVVPVTVRVTDNGAPNLSATRSFNVTVNDGNSAPVLTIGGITKTIPFGTFENIEEGMANGSVLFREPLYTTTTDGFLDATPNSSIVATNFPDMDTNTSAYVLATSFSFKTGTSNPWLKLSTRGTAALATPTIDLGQRLKFDIYTDRSIKLGLGVRETDNATEIGASGGINGTVEWLGVSSVTGTKPNPTRTISPTNWTTVEFNLPSEPIVAYPASGNGVLSTTTGRGTLDHLAIVPNNGMGAYNIWFDNFKVITPTTNLTVKTLETITVQTSATDSDVSSEGVFQTLTFSLDFAPTNAEIDDMTGEFTWTPTVEQGSSTNVISIRVTDDGSPALSDVKNITIIVQGINTVPRLQEVKDEYVELNSGGTVTFTAAADDSDVPANTLTYSLVAPPSGATINATTGDFSWTPPNVLGTNTLTLRVTDNGVPALYTERDFNIIVVPANSAPVLSLGTARVTEKVVNYESFTNGTPSEQVMFKKPANSGTTSNFIDTNATNYTTVTTNFPTGNANAGSKVMKVGWTFKTGTTNYWVRLNTFDTQFVPNPTINLNARVKFDVHSSKALLVTVGCRETGTTAAIGADGGTSGTIEYVGYTGGVPNHSVLANTWTTLEFDLDNEGVATLSGNGILADGKGVLESLGLIGNGGTGVYTVYLDNFEVVTTATLPGTVTMPANSTLQFTAVASDSDSPAQPLTYSLDADAHTNAVINATNGVFTWTPSNSDVGTTNSITVNVDDQPLSNGISKSDAETITVIVTSDSLGVQDGAADLVSAGETIWLEWNSVPGTTYRIQSKENLADAEWTDLGWEVIANGEVSSTSVTNGEVAKFYRIVEATGSNSSDQ